MHPLLRFTELSQTCGIRGLRGTAGSALTGLLRTCRHLTRRRARCLEGEMQLVSSSEIENSLHRGYLQIILKLACAFKRNKPRRPCLNVGPVTDTGILLVSGAEPLTSLKATGALSGCRNPPRCRGQLRAGLKSGCHHRSPKPAVYIPRNRGTRSRAQIPSFRCCTFMLYTSDCQHPSLTDTTTFLTKF